MGQLIQNGDLIALNNNLHLKKVSFTLYFFQISYYFVLL